MKKYLFLFLFSIPFVSQAAPCDGVDGRLYRNSDGSLGGFVAKGVSINGRLFLDSTSEICGKVKISGSPSITDGSFISDDVEISGSPKIQGSRIYESAKVSGGAIIQNSEVCQTSALNGSKVIGSSYYCQTEDPQPKDPGEAGMRGLIGVDSDGDGVRDDVERFINLNLPNTEKLNRAKEREASKTFALLLRLEMIFLNNKDRLIQISDLKRNLLGCHNVSIASEIFGASNNTKERLFSVIKAGGASHGQVVSENKKDCMSVAAFRDAARTLDK